MALPIAVLMECTGLAATWYGSHVISERSHAVDQERFNGGGSTSLAMRARLENMKTYSTEP